MEPDCNHPSPALEKSAGSLPLTMSLPLSRAIKSYEKGNYKDSLIHLLDFFEMSVQWLNCYLLTLACETKDGGNLKGVIRAVRMIDNKRPLSFGDCVNEIFNPLLESLVKIYPHHPLLKSLTENVKSRRFDLLVGSAKEIGIIKIRNDYKGHSTSLSEEIYRNVLEQVLPKAEAMANGVAPLSEAKIVTVTKAGETVDLHGGWNKYIGTDDKSAEPYHYYVGFEGIGTFDLFPLIIQRDDQYIYIFQTLKDEAVKYESSDENVRGFETEQYNTQFDAFLQRLNPSFDIAKESNWNELCECMKLRSASYMIQVQKEKKYSSELFVDRKQLTGLLDRFTSSESTLLPLSGDAGQGKTNQMCNWTERFLESDTPVLIFNSSDFSDSALDTTIKTVFGVSQRRPVKRILDHLHNKAIENGKKVYFFFDAVNECLHYKKSDDNVLSGVSEIAPLLLYKDILTHLISTEYPNFKIVTTCRSYTWKNQILPNISLPDTLVLEEGDDANSQVVGFTDEETETAYRKYEELYQMTTPFEQLDRRIMLRLHDPLVMKFVCSNYVGSVLSPKSDDYTSVSLFSKMISDIRDHSFAGRNQCRLLEELSRIFLNSYLQGTPVGSITNVELKNAYADESDPYHRLSHLIYKNDGITVAYTELRNKPERPILREVEKTVKGERVRSVEFIYERFLEYMMARVFLAEEHSRHGKVNADTFVRAFSGAAVNVVFIGTMRNAVIMEIMRSSDYRIMIDLISDHSDNSDIMQLVNDVLDAMIRENFEKILFSLISGMIAARPDDPELIGRFNSAKQEIASNKATPETIARHNEFASRLLPIMNLRNSAEVAVNNLLLSDFFNENLYSGNVLNLLWKLMMDEITDVSNEACKFVYYLSRRRFTHSHTPLRENLTKKIVQEMYRDIKSRTVVGNIVRSNERRKSLVFVEAATRLATLLIIDATVSKPQDVTMIREMLSEIRGIAGYFTWNYRMIRLIMPFLQTIMRKQITFQSVYVNNAVEYQGFWNDNIVPADAPEGMWSRRRLRDAMEFVGLYDRHHLSLSSEECKAELDRFRDFVPVVISAYMSGCSFSYFIMERITIIVGSADWSVVRPIFRKLLYDSPHDFEWFDYLQMSLLYSLLQLQINSSEHNPEILQMITEQSRDWTIRCRGLFKARHSHKANPTGLYKRNVINWYCMAYSAHSGDNVAHEGDSRPVPMLYDLIDLAVAENDKELLIHLLDNIAELISDAGYIRTALGALKYVMMKYETQEAVDSLDNADCERFAGENLIDRVRSVLSTAKTYFPGETDAFLRSEVIGLKFPGVDGYREDILNYHTGGETLSDLFTHKFGNFLLWSLLNEKEVDDFSYEAVCAAIDSKDCFEWFDQVIRILCKRMFNVKL